MVDPVLTEAYPTVLLLSSPFESLYQFEKDSCPRGFSTEDEVWGTPEKDVLSFTGLVKQEKRKDKYQSVPLILYGIGICLIVHKCRYNKK